MQSSFADIDGSFPRLPVVQPEAWSDNKVVFARRLIYGADSQDVCLTELTEPTWNQIVAAVSNISGCQYVHLEGAATFPYLVVAGGRNEEYLVVIGQEQGLLFLRNPKPQRQTEFRVAIGGEASDYPSDLCVDKETMLKALWWFVVAGEQLPSLCWVQDAWQ